MLDLHALLLGLAAVLALAVAGWVVATALRNVSLVDVLWGPLWFASAATYASTVASPGPRTILVLSLTGLWAARLAGYIAWRNWGEGEDRRYRAIRRRNEPNFGWKSLYLVFGLQGLLAWVLVLPVIAAISAPAPLGALDLLGAVIWLSGIAFEATADAQLARFKADPAHAGQVMDRGLWAFTRHPNYFGECLAWWGAYLVAVSAGAAWTIFSPLLLTWLLLRVSGVALLERSITERRPGYEEYRRRTPAFLPRLPFARGLAVLAMLVLACGEVQAGSPSPETGAWRFRVLLDGREIGHHEFRLDTEGELRRLTSRAEFDVKFFAIPFYSYRHEATETWRGDCLERIESRTDDNGTRSNVSGTGSASGITLAGPPAESLPGCIMTFAYWNPAFLLRSRLLNPQTGRYVPVSVSEPAEDTIEVRGATRQAVKRQLFAEGGVIDLWYSTAGDWLALSSSPDGKRRLEYRLQ